MKTLPFLTSLLIAGQFLLASPLAARAQGCAPTNCVDLVCPADIVVACTPGVVGAFVTVPAPQLTNTCGGIVPTGLTVQCYGPDGQLITPGNPTFFPPGTNVITCCYVQQTPIGVYRDCCCYRIIVRNCPPTDFCEPVIQCPPDMIRCATNQPGVIVDYPQPQITIPCPPGKVTIQSVVYSMPSGSFFPLGTTTVSICVRWLDSAGQLHQTCCCFTVLVRCCQQDCVDILDCPTQPITVQCGQPAPLPYYTNTCGQTLTLECNPPAGTPIISNQTVCCWIKNAAGIIVKECCFQVRVVDTIPPVIQCPTNIVLQSPNCQGIVWTPPPPSASDNCNLAGVSCNYPPGNFFPVGTNIVTCCAWDSAGNTNCCSYQVIVRCCQYLLDCPQQIIVDCCQPFNFTPFYTNNCGASNYLTSTIPAGTKICSDTNVCFFLHNALGQIVKECCIQIKVVDTTPPVIVCPSNIFVLCARFIPQFHQYGAWVSFAAPAKDNCDPHPTVVFSKPPGFFPEGCTNVTVTATDASGNTSTCTFKVCVLRAGCYVKNPSFEFIAPTAPVPGFCGDPIPWALHWTNLAGMPEVFRPALGVPNNCYGSEKPCHGTNYAGLEGGYVGNVFQTEAMMGQLVAPLTPGQQYAFNACLSLAESSPGPVYVEFLLANWNNPTQNFVFHRTWVAKKVGWQSPYPFTTPYPFCPVKVPNQGTYNAIIIRASQVPPTVGPYPKGYVYVDNVNLCCCPTLHDIGIKNGQVVVRFPAGSTLQHTTNLNNPLGWQPTPGRPEVDPDTGDQTLSYPLSSFFDVFFRTSEPDHEDVDCPTCPPPE